MEETKYVVTVPPNVHAGDYFNVQLGPQHRVYTIRCPEGSGPGSLVDIRIAQTVSSGGSQPVYTVHRLPTEQTRSSTSDAKIAALLSGQVFFILALFILLTLAYALPRFASMLIGSNCQVTNPADGSQLYELYYNLFNGLGSTRECITSATEFCIPWSDVGTWGRIDNIVRRGSNMQYDSKYGWQASQVLIPLSSAFCMLSALTLLFLMYLIRNKTFNRYNISSSIGCACTFLLLTWVFSFSGLNDIIYSSSLSPVTWSTFFKAGYPLKAVITNDVANTTPIPVPSCSIAISLADGGITLSIATSLAFVTSVILCCIRWGTSY